MHPCLRDGQPLGALPMAGLAGPPIVRAGSAAGNLVAAASAGECRIGSIRRTASARDVRCEVRCDSEQTRLAARTSVIGSGAGAAG